MNIMVSETGCWLWQGPTDQDGYGKVSIGGATLRAHRVMAQLMLKPYLRPSEVIAHRCDTPACINPAHLFITTNAGNTADRDAKGRGCCGARHPLAKLTAEDVLKIRGMIRQGYAAEYIAEATGSTAANVYAIKAGRTWKHLVG